MIATGTVATATEGRKDLQRSVVRLCDQGVKPQAQNFVAHAHAYSQAATAVRQSLLRFCGDNQADQRLVAEWVAHAKAFERTAMEADRTGFSPLSIDALRSNWGLLTAAESRMFQVLASDQGAVQFRVLAGRFKREQEAAFRRTMNPQMLAPQTPPTHRVRRQTVHATR